MSADPINKAIRAEIEQRLADIERDEGVRILLAVESGSRAWGFPSPDSDFDVRFVYSRSVEEYLSLSPPRDVIERSIIDEIDLNGWDLRKALGLLLKSNAVVSEWIESPIRYRPDDAIIRELTDLADRLFDPRGIAKHYESLGRNALGKMSSGAKVAVKHYFYALRTALSIRALRRTPDRRPPMTLMGLVDAGCSDQKPMQI